MKKLIALLILCGFFFIRHDINQEKQLMSQVVELQTKVGQLSDQLEKTRVDFKQLEIRQNVSDDMSERIAVVEGRKRGGGS